MMSLLGLERKACAGECGNSVTSRSEFFCSTCCEIFCMDCTVKCPSCTFLWDHYHGNSRCSRYICANCIEGEDVRCFCCGVVTACGLKAGRCPACRYCGSAYGYEYHGSDENVENAKSTYEK